MNTPPGKTKQHFETQMGINCLGHFLLARLLAPLTKRQVWVSSRAHAWSRARPLPRMDKRRAPPIDLPAIVDVNPQSYNGWMRYQQSKLGNILLAKQFAARYSHLQAVAVSPGMVSTCILRYNRVPAALVGALLRLVGAQTPAQGCRTQVYCAVTDPTMLHNGGYYHACRLANEADVAKNVQDAQDFFDFCNEQTRAFQE